MQTHFIKKGQLLLLLSFALLIFAGTLLLMLPGIIAISPGRLEPLDALFLSCSAVCLNGLALYPHEFTFFGQIILLLLIQCGSLGIMSLSAAIILMLRKNLSVGDALMLNNINDRFSLRSTELLTRLILSYTLICEAAGMLLMFPAFLMQNPGPWLPRIATSLWHSIFFSVSSFCNAGVGPLPDSLFSVGRYVQAISMVQIVLGGIGIYVIYDLIQWLKTPQLRLRLRLHSRIVLWTSALLIFGGALLMWILSLRVQGGRIPWFDALFFSVASRTTGFATMPLGLLTPLCQVLLIVLMIIGGSPGSCAGGIKTTTLAVIVATLSSSFKGDTSVIIAHRTMQMRSVLRAFAIVTVFLAEICIGAILLNYFAGDPAGKPMLNCFFEATSALSATGYSLEPVTTASWNGISKGLLIFFMFTGRVGPLTMILFLTAREKSGRLRYPEERVIVG